MAPSPSETNESFRRQEELRYRAHMAAVEQLTREIGENAEYSDDEYPTDMLLSRVSKSNAPSPSPHLPCNKVFSIEPLQRIESACSLASTQRDHSFYSPPIPTIEMNSEVDETSMCVAHSHLVTSESTVGTFNNSPCISFHLAGDVCSTFHDRLHAIGNHYASTLAFLGKEFRATLENVQVVYEAEWEKVDRLPSADVENRAHQWLNELEENLRTRLMSFTEGLKGELGGLEEEFEKILRQ